MLKVTLSCPCCCPLLAAVPLGAEPARGRQREAGWLVDVLGLCWLLVEDGELVVRRVSLQ